MDSQEIIAVNETAIIQNQTDVKRLEEVRDLSVYVPEKVRKPGEIFFATLWIILGALGYYFAISMTSDSYSAPSVFPKLTSALIIVCGLVILTKALKRERPEPDSPGVFQYLLPRDVLVMITLVILYCFSLPRLHFFPSSLAFLSAGMIYLYRGKKIIQSVVISVATLAVLIAIFRYVFMVILP